MVTKISLFLILLHLHRGLNSPLRQDRGLRHPNELVPILVPTHHATNSVLPQNVPTHPALTQAQNVPTHHGSITIHPINLHQVHPQTVPARRGTITVLHPVPVHQGTIAIHPQLVPIHQSTAPVNSQDVSSRQATAAVGSRQKKGPSIISFPISQILVPKFHIIPTQSNIHQNSVHTQHIVSGNNIQIPVISQTVTHSANITHPPLIPILFPLHHNLVPLQDLSVIPLQKNIHGQNLGHYRTMEKMEQEEEEQVNRFRAFYGGYGTGLFFGGHGAGHGFHIFG